MSRSPRSVRPPLLAVLLAAAVAVPAAADWTPVLELRLRGEAFETPAASPAADRSYDFASWRLRGGVEAEFSKLSVRLVGQAAGSEGLPAMGAFGIGPVYVAANRGDTSPSAVGLLEAYADLGGERFRLRLGRQPFPAESEGAGARIDVPHLESVRKRRLAERLLGNWDWVNVGRRYDGASFTAHLAALDLAGFAVRPLAGGVNYDDAFEELDELTVYGLSLGSGYGGWVPGADLRAFAIVTEDERPGARAAAGGDLDITTVGGSALLGNERADLMLWGAVQRGDWGRRDQDAWAGIVEGGWRLGGRPGSPELRAGVARASGGAGGDHETFYNLLPTNHKFYGSLDYSAFMNLEDRYVLLTTRLSGRWSLTAGVHEFALVDRRDAWYGGSGAFNEAVLGFAARRPPGGRFPGDEVGQEVDLGLKGTLGEHSTLLVGGGWFDGGEVVEAVQPDEQDGTWLYLQLAWGI